MSICLNRFEKDDKYVEIIEFEGPMFSVFEFDGEKEWEETFGYRQCSAESYYDRLVKKYEQHISSS